MTGSYMSLLLFLMLQKRSRHSFRYINSADAGIRFYIRQDKASRTVLFQFRKAVIHIDPSTFLQELQIGLVATLQFMRIIDAGTVGCNRLFGYINVLPLKAVDLPYGSSSIELYSAFIVYLLCDMFFSDGFQLPS